MISVFSWPTFSDARAYHFCFLEIKRELKPQKCGIKRRRFRTVYLISCIFTNLSATFTISELKQQRSLAIGNRGLRDWKKMREKKCKLVAVVYLPKFHCWLTLVRLPGEPHAISSPAT